MQEKSALGAAPISRQPLAEKESKKKILGMVGTAFRLDRAGSREMGPWSVRDGHRHFTFCGERWVFWDLGRADGYR